jgi:hypothetical protein
MCKDRDVSPVMEEDIKAGRAGRRWPLVVEILQGRTTVAEVRRSFEPLGFPGPV